MGNLCSMQAREDEEDNVDLVCYLPANGNVIKQINFTEGEWIGTEVKQDGINFNTYNKLIAGPAGPQEQLLFMIGGGDNDDINKKIYQVEKREDTSKSIQYQFIEKTSLKWKRNDHSLCWYEQEKYIVISGGQDVSFSTIPSCELYNIEEDTVSQLPPLNTARHLHTSISVKDTIYVFCGQHVNPKYLNSIERLSKPLEQESKWEVIQVAPSQQLKQNGAYQGVVQLQDQPNKLLVFGGYPDKTQSLIFDIKKSELTPTKGQLPQSAMFRNNLVIQDRKTNVVYSVDKLGKLFFQYDTNTEQWTKIQLEEKKQE